MPLSTGRIEAARTRLLNLLDKCEENDTTLSFDLQAMLQALDGYQRVDNLLTSSTLYGAADLRRKHVAQALYGWDE